MPRWRLVILQPSQFEIPLKKTLKCNKWINYEVLALEDMDMDDNDGDKGDDGVRWEDAYEQNIWINQESVND